MTPFDTWDTPPPGERVAPFPTQRETSTALYDIPTDTPTKFCVNCPISAYHVNVQGCCVTKIYPVPGLRKVPNYDERHGCCYGTSTTVLSVIVSLCSTAAVTLRVDDVDILHWPGEYVSKMYWFWGWDTPVSRFLSASSFSGSRRCKLL